jgi:hypothetical protein
MKTNLNVLQTRIFCAVVLGIASLSVWPQRQRIRLIRRQQLRRLSRTVRKFTDPPLRGLAVVVPEHAPHSLGTVNLTRTWKRRKLGSDDLVLKRLRISFAVIMKNEISDGPALPEATSHAGTVLTPTVLQAERTPRIR